MQCKTLLGIRSETNDNHYYYYYYKHLYGLIYTPSILCIVYIFIDEVTGSFIHNTNVTKIKCCFLSKSD